MGTMQKKNLHEPTVAGVPQLLDDLSKLIDDQETGMMMQIFKFPFYDSRVCRELIFNFYLQLNLHSSFYIHTVWVHSNFIEDFLKLNYK